MVVVGDVGDVVESDVLVAVGEAAFEDEHGRQYRLEIKDALLDVRGHQLALLKGLAIAVHVKAL
jgi:hypothetical protein